jgi:hypothetical protein
VKRLKVGNRGRARTKQVTRQFFSVRALAMGSYYTYLVGRITGEVAVFDSQGPAVEDRSTLAKRMANTVSSFFV